MCSSPAHCNVLPVGMEVVFISFISYLCDTVPRQMQLMEGFIWLTVPIHHGREVMAAGARDSWSHCICNRDEDGEMNWCLAYFFLCCLGSHSPWTGAAHIQGGSFCLH